MGLETNTLYYGDCLDWMSRWDDQSVDLIYLDPPFNSKTTYNILYSTRGAGRAQYRAFDDTWRWDTQAASRYDNYDRAAGRPAHRAIAGLYHILGPSGMMAYLTYMAERLEQMHRLLKPTGSIYLHCDDTVSHYLKIVMDAIFGVANFRNEITWRRTTSHNNVSRNYGSITDTLLFYTKSEAFTFHLQYAPYSVEHIAKIYKYVDEDGRRYCTSNIRNPGVRPNLTYEYKGYQPHPNGWTFSRERMEQLDREGRLHFPKSKSGRIRLKLYLDEMPGTPIVNVWDDVQFVQSHAKERLGYPTQKPLALLERIIKASSNDGDLVLDPFCGCGTAIEAARKLNRQWIGIDISAFAIDLIKSRRLQDQSIPAKGIPYDLQSARKLAKEAPFNFESWAVTRLPGFIPNTKQVADGGVDGRGTLFNKPDDYESRLALAQVKGGKFSLSGLRDFIGVTDRDRAAIGCFITLEPVQTRAAVEAIAGAGRIRVSGHSYPRAQLWPISDYFDHRRPILPNMPLMADPYTGQPLQLALM